MVWVGGLALALGGIFLVKYSIEQGLLGPEVRILLGVLAGLTMIGIGELARRKSLSDRIAGLDADYIPPTLTGAGIISLFASIYAGYALYDLFPGFVTFALLVAIAVGALALSLRHGASLALMGLVGSLLVPGLVSTNQPSA